MKIVFAGTPEFALPTLDALINSSHEIIAVYTQPDRPSGRGRLLHESPVKQLALKHNIPVFQPIKLTEKINAEFDVMIVVAYGLLLPQYILDKPKYGCINIHGSLLPRWRGAAPIHRALLAGDSETGITIMKMDKGLDTGDMLYKLKIPIENTDTIKILHDKLSHLGSEGLLYVLNNLANITPEKQDNNLSTYAPKITKQETYLDFTKSAEELNRAVRAYYPANVLLNNQLIKLWETTVIETTGASGKIIKSDPSGIDVGTGNGVLRILKLQLPGGKILSARELLNSKADLFSVGHQFQST